MGRRRQEDLRFKPGLSSKTLSQKNQGLGWYLSGKCLPSIHKALVSLTTMKKIYKICKERLKELPESEL
jgi:hypothetical protein